MPQSKTEMIHARIDPKLKQSAEQIFSEIVRMRIDGQNAGIHG